MIVVTGASGQLGRAILEQLVTRVPVAEVGASVRDPEKAKDLEARGIRVRRGDYAEADSLAYAFERATQVLLISSNARATGGDTLAQHRAAIAAARTAGVRRILYTSHMAASASSEFPPARDHAATEEMLRESGVAWTALRDGFHAASGLAMMGDAFATGVFAAPADGKVCWTTHADLAAAAAAILADEGRFDGPTPPLTSTELADFADIARIAEELGRPIRRETITDDELRTAITSRGAPPTIAEIALGYYRASRNGEFACTDPTLACLIGRPPQTMRDVVAAKLAR